MAIFKSIRIGCLNLFFELGNLLHHEFDLLVERQVVLLVTTIQPNVIRLGQGKGTVVQKLGIEGLAGCRGRGKSLLGPRLQMGETILGGPQVSCQSFRSKVLGFHVTRTTELGPVTFVRGNQRPIGIIPGHGRRRKRANYQRSNSSGTANGGSRRLGAKTKHRNHGRCRDGCSQEAKNNRTSRLELFSQSENMTLHRAHKG